MRLQQSAELNSFQEVKNATTGTYVTQKGFGWASEWKPSKIIVRICTEDGETEVWIDKYFREHWGRLTAKRIKK